MGDGGLTYALIAAATVQTASAIQARGAENRRMKAEKRIAALREARARREAARETQQAMARNVLAATSSGLSPTASQSTFTGAQGALLSNAASNTAFQNQLSMLGDDIFEANRDLSRAQTVSTIAGIASNTTIGVKGLQK